MSNEEIKLWHYTSGRQLPSIIESKEIRPGTAAIPKSEKPAAWFTTNPVWENTCNKMLRMSSGRIFHCRSKEETALYCGGIVRIRINPQAAPYTFQDFKRLSRISNNRAKALAAVAIEKGSKPSEWRVSFNPVPQSEWLGIDVWDGEKWKPDPDLS